MDALLKKPVLLTIGLVIVLIVILLISGANTTMNIFAIVVILALIAMVWFKYLQEKNSKDSSPVIPHVEESAPLHVEPEKQEKTASPEEDEDIRTKTGSPCEKAGIYVCKDHPKRTVTMKEGNRFPPCRGIKKGHSTVWILKE